MVPLSMLLLKSNETKLRASPMAGGIEPVKLFPEMLKCAREAKEGKSRWSRVPERPPLARLIWETVVLLLQTIPDHLQRFFRPGSDHELSDEDEEGEEEMKRVFFHLTRASASVLADAAFVSSTKKLMRKKNAT
ncbi:unnamed protein product [Cuscuta campestris]|uniref:Uncharacterized protein n=2 Tax=Cuscuta sect. Cleistogrammica TaxID=1824901 RepID=A0A484NM40_9ASTE|nr:hypothetical protein DM860_012590 [Cuscuta australis]VFR02053.1 unnamed protein product [Cuscuta campestris]